MTTQSSECVFCDRTKFEDRIIHEDEWFFVIPTLGQFVPDGGYSLVIPKRHVRCSAEMELGEIRVFENLISRVAQATATLWGGGASSVSIFEHGIVGQTVPHAHMHIVPRTLFDLDKQVWVDFPGANWRRVYTLTTLPSQYENEGSRPYLLYSPQYPYQPASVIYPDDSTPVPAQYFRSAAAEMITGDAANGNWRSADPDVDKERMDETLRRLAPYFTRKES